MQDNQLTGRNIATAFAAVKLKGAAFSVITADGELLFEFGLEPGLHDLKPVAERMPKGAVLDFKASEATILKRGEDTIRSIGTPHFRDTGANPNFKPRRMDPGQMQHLEEMVEVAKKEAVASAKKAFADEVNRLRKKEEAKGNEEPKPKGEKPKGEKSKADDPKQGEKPQGGGEE